MKSGETLLPRRSKLEMSNLNGAAAIAWVSTDCADEHWDQFLQESPLGHFQQSSIWSAVKLAEGWHAVRVVVTQAEEILGGFQILVRTRKTMREGFLNKGPVYRKADPHLLQWLLDLVEKVARSERLTLLVTQAADGDAALASLQDERGYSANGVAEIITATLCVPLGAPHPPAETRMRKTIRTEARQAVRRGVTVREGTAADIPLFFEMMRISCLRQNTSPNPASASALGHLWERFADKGLARLTIADCEGQPTAGVLALKFGTRVTQWKKGWNESHREKHPNTLLTFESVQWAERIGATLYDFVGSDRASAKAVLRGELPAEGLLASRHFFLMGFGAQPQLLPLARVWIPFRPLRVIYRCVLPLLVRLGRVEQ